MMVVFPFLWRIDPDIGLEADLLTALALGDDAHLLRPSDKPFDVVDLLAGKAQAFG